MKRQMTAAFSAAIVAWTLPGIVEQAGAATVPFTEDFVADSADWFDASGAVPLTWVAAGGPDGGSYASSMFNFADSAPDDSPPLFRAEEIYGSSGGAFNGNWVDDGVTLMTYFVRHDAPVPLTYFSRFAPSLSPGAIALNFVPIPADTWTEIVVPIDEGSPFIYEGPIGFDDVFTDIGRVQSGIVVPAALAGVDETFTFDIDKVSIVPEPSMLSCLLIGSAGLTLRRRKRV